MASERILRNEAKKGFVLSDLGFAMFRSWCLVARSKASVLCKKNVSVDVGSPILAFKESE